MKSTIRSKTIMLVSLFIVAIIVGSLYLGVPCWAQGDGGAPPPMPPDGAMGADNGAPPPPQDGSMGPDNGAQQPPNEAMHGDNGAPMPPPDSGQEQDIETTAVYSQDGGKVTKTEQTFESTEPNESVIKVFDGGIFNLSNSTINKSEGDSTAIQNSDFYGLNAGVLAETKAKITLTDCTITTSASGANAVFATGKGSKIILNNVKIMTTGRGSSRGLEATFNGSVIANNVDISTTGAHCAALATDRGEGTVTLTGGTLTTAGEGSPIIYSTGNISATNIKGTATGSEAAVIEGKNSITLTNSTLTGHLKCGAMLYQSFSGDASVGTSVFTMTGGLLTANVGPVFYCTNTKVKVNLNNAILTSKSGEFINAAAGQWGRHGRNGAEVILKAENENIEGNITCDNISTITATLSSATTLKGSINTKNKAKSISLSLDKTSKWEVTGASYLTALTDEDATLANIVDNGFIIYYDSSVSANSWLAGKTYDLTNGGKLTPK